MKRVKVYKKFFLNDAVIGYYDDVRDVIREYLEESEDFEDYVANIIDETEGMVTICGHEYYKSVLLRKADSILFEDIVYEEANYYEQNEIEKAVEQMEVEDYESFFNVYVEVVEEEDV